MPEETLSYQEAIAIDNERHYPIQMDRMIRALGHVRNFRQRPRVVRVGISTNFNSTAREWKDLIDITMNQGRTYWFNLPFINTAAFEPIRVPLPHVVTCNPCIIGFIAPSPQGEECFRVCPPEYAVGEDYLQDATDYIRAIRLRWVPGPTSSVADTYAEAIAWARKRRIPILWTKQRFPVGIKRSRIERYTNAYDTYYRQGPWLKTRENPMTDSKMFFMCDESGKGCPACRLCSILTYGLPLVPWGLDLSSSIPPTRVDPETGELFSKRCKYAGVCAYCYAEVPFKGRGQYSIHTDEITMNAKMHGYQGWEEAWAQKLQDSGCYDSWCLVDMSGMEE